MAIPQMQRVAIENFRSIRGRVIIPLNAPIVLVHGANGAGKTSVLSAMELALTGEVQSLGRADRNYRRHLVHRGERQAKVELTAQFANGAEARNTEVVVADGSVAGSPALDTDLQAIYAERCYLAQSTVGRLLEIYQHSRGDGESPLTRFVNDVLGLDRVDALLEGLHAVGDIRRLRRLIPGLGELESQIGSLREHQQSLNTTAEQLGERQVQLRELIGKLSEGSGPISRSLSWTRTLCSSFLLRIQRPERCLR